MSSTSWFDWTAYLRMSLCLIGMISSIINLCVFLSSQLKDTSYKFMMTKSIANMLYLAIAFIIEIVSYCYSCPWVSTYFAQLYFIVGGMVLPGLLTIFRILIELSVSVYTYCILVNRAWTGKYTHIWVILVFAIISVGLYLCNGFYFNIVQYDYEYVTYFTVEKTSLYINAYSTITMVQMFLRVILSILVVPVVNIVNLFIFKRRYQNNNIFPFKLSGENINKLLETAIFRNSADIRIIIGF